MKEVFKQFARTTVSVLVLAMLFVGVQVVFAAWSDPTQAPPGGNTPAPLNIGPVDQVKSAGLSLDALSVFGQVMIQDGTEGEGKVLTSDENGVARWETSSGGGGSLPAPAYDTGWVAIGGTNPNTRLQCEDFSHNLGTQDLFVYHTGYSLNNNHENLTIPSSKNYGGNYYSNDGQQGGGWYEIKDDNTISLCKKNRGNYNPWHNQRAVIWTF